MQYWTTPDVHISSQKLTKADSESVNDACRNAFLNEALHDSSDILAVIDLACTGR